MSYASVTFLLFVAGTWILNAIAPRKLRYLVLLLASLAFYAICDFWSGLWIVSCILITYSSGNLIYKHFVSNGAKKAVLAGCMIYEFGLLAVFKFAGLAARTLPSIFGSFSAGLMLPLGLSFFIFQSAGYVIDIYREKYPPEKNIAKYALFVSFFPQIVQGPIGRYDNLAPTLFANARPSPDDLRHGIQLILWGLIKKTILADRVAVLVDSVFAKPELHGGIVSAIAALFYCIQIYCDFSGGIDISRGVAEGLGVRLDINFSQPFFASSVQDYWRRWHITLGSWMRDYLFYPLSLSRAFGKLGKRLRKLLGARTGKLIPALLANFIVFFVIGVWHGGAWKYMVFGVWNGFLITSALFLEPFFDKIRKTLKINVKSKAWHVFRILRTFVIVGVGRILTRANNTSEALIMMKNILTRPKTSHIAAGALTQFGLTGTDYIIIIAATVVLLLADTIAEYVSAPRDFIEKRRPVTQFLFIVVSLFVLVYFGAYRSGYISAQFIYGKF